MQNITWHPASERPPKTSTILLLAIKKVWQDKYGKMLQGFVQPELILGCYYDGRWYDEAGENLPQNIVVTHWMTLPKVPEEA